MRYKIKERMKKVKGYTDYYISDIGNVYSIKSGQMKQLTPDIRRNKKGKAIKYCVRLYKNGVPKFFYVHRLVADAFVGDVTNKVVHHDNTVRTDNRASNLVPLDYAEHSDIHAKRRKAATYAIKHGALDLKGIKKMFEELMKG